MSNNAQGPSAMASGPSFGGWTLDARTGALAGADGAGTTLRPKTAAVLARLLATPGVLVTREELLDSVWPGVSVTDDSVTQCIAEIRRALGGDGKLLRTAPRRGYVLEAPALPRQAAPAVPPAEAGGTRGRWVMAALGGAGLAAAAWMVLAVMPPQTSRAGFSVSQRLMKEGRAAFYGSGAEQDNWLRARSLFLRAHDADPSNADADAWASFTYANMVVGGYSTDAVVDLSQAERLADRAVALGPDLGDALAARAGVYRLQRRFGEALATYRRAVALDPTQFPARANAGWMLVLLGQPHSALLPLRSVLAARPGHPFRSTWLCYLGVAQMLAGDGDHGVEAFRSIPGKADNCLHPADLSFHLAAALALDGQMADARSLLAAASEQWPGMTGQSLRDHALSTDPAYLERREALFEGLSLAGFTSGPPAP